MALTIKTLDGSDKRIEVTGLPFLQLEKAEEAGFLAALQVYLQHFYDQGFKNVSKVEIPKRFGSGKSGALVFPIVLFTPGADPKLNHYRVLKYDDTSRVQQELLRYNSLASQAGGTFEQLEAFSSEKFPEKSLLILRNVGEHVRRVDELFTCVRRLFTRDAGDDAHHSIRKALQDVLGGLYERHYCNSDHELARLPDFKNREVREIFAALFPAVRVIDEDVSGSFDREGSFIGLDAVRDPEYRFRKKYLLTREKPEDKISLIEVNTRNEVDEKTIIDFLTSPVEDQRTHRIQGLIIEERPLDEYIRKSVTSSALPDGMLDWQKLYAGLQCSLALPYWAFYLHHDLNPSNILIIENADGTIQGRIIDYYSFGRGGHLFIDITRLEVMLIMEYMLHAWQDLIEQQDYAALQRRAHAIERALFRLDAEQPDVSRAERGLLEIALEIRRIGLNWLITRKTHPPEAEMAYRNYLFARYAYLLAFQKYSQVYGPNVPKKQQLALLSADALLNLIQEELENLDIVKLLADLNAASERFAREHRRIVIDATDVGGAEAFRKTKETALLVIMLIDIVNSTQLREDLGEVHFQNILEEQKSTLTSIIEKEHTGKVVKDTGDGLLAVFAVPDASVQRALDIQESLVSHPIIQVRIGLDMGQVTQEADERGIIKDVFGAHVNRAARLEALCESGHVLTSYSVWDSAKGWLKHQEHVQWQRHGRYLLKGIADPVEVFEPYDRERIEASQTLAQPPVEPVRPVSEESPQAQEVFQHFADAPVTLARHIRLREFQSLIEERTQSFVGRQFIFDRITPLLHNPEFPSGYIVIKGEPGIGKTTLLAQLVKQAGYVHHFNIASQNIRSHRDFLQNICAQLIVRYGLEYAMLPQDAAENSAFLSKLLSEAAEKAENRPVVVLVDALDEVEDIGIAPDANRLYLPSSLPKGVFFVVTVREEHDYRLLVDRREDIYLEDKDPDNLEDVSHYIRNVIEAHRSEMEDRIAQWHVEEDEFVSVLTERSEGNFMYLIYVLRDIRIGKLTARNIDNIHKLPKNLEAYYQKHWGAMKDLDADLFERRYQPVVCLLATVREPVSIAQLVEWTALQPYEIAQVIQTWREFLNEDESETGEPLYRVYHRSFQEFLRKEVGLTRYHGIIAGNALNKIIGW